MGGGTAAGQAECAAGHAVITKRHPSQTCTDRGGRVPSAHLEGTLFLVRSRELMEPARDPRPQMDLTVQPSTHDSDANFFVESSCRGNFGAFENFPGRLRYFGGISEDFEALGNNRPPDGEACRWICCSVMDTRKRLCEELRDAERGLE